jgi:hypothetical protein
MTRMISGTWQAVAVARWVAVEALVSSGGVGVIRHTRGDVPRS